MIASESRAGITIVRLEHHALTPSLLHALVDHLRQAATTRKPVVLTGSGHSFCAGADLHWLSTFNDPSLGVAELVAIHHLAITTIVDMPVPLIAAVNGSVAGGGMGLALAADYVLAGESASFTAAYFRLGLTPDGGTSAFLERSIGPLRTRELLLTNRRLSAREACEWRLANRVVPDAELLDAAVEFATSLQHVPGETLLETRRLLDASFLRDQLQRESVAIRTAARSAFFKQAIADFRASHPPQRA